MKEVDVQVDTNMLRKLGMCLVRHSRCLLRLLRFAWSLEESNGRSTGEVDFWWIDN